MDISVVCYSNMATSSIQKLSTKLKEIGVSSTFWCEPVAKSRCNLCIIVGKNDVNLANLDSLLSYKKNLLLRALPIKTLHYTVLGEAVMFSWFYGIPQKYVVPYTKLLMAICNVTTTQLAWSSLSKSSSLSFDFKCFLLRLGFIEDEYKEDRQLLLEYAKKRSYSL